MHSYYTYKGHNIYNLTLLVYEHASGAFCLYLLGFGWVMKLVLT
jgi:hypothetical protein